MNVSPNSDKPITRDDLHELKDYLANALKEHEAKTQEFVRDVQTEILRAFHTFEQSREVRFSRLKAEVSNLDQEASTRLKAVEQRLMAIEEKLILWPPPKQ